MGLHPTRCFAFYLSYLLGFLGCIPQVPEGDIYLIKIDALHYSLGWSQLNKNREKIILAGGFTSKRECQKVMDSNPSLVMKTFSIFNDYRGN